MNSTRADTKMIEACRLCASLEYPSVMDRRRTGTLTLKKAAHLRASMILYSTLEKW
jgi:hypothetical protein